MSSTPTARSLAWLREQGYLADVCERWLPHTHVRKDLFGFLDLVAIRPGEILGVQVTTGSNLMARLRKAQSLPALAAWIAAGGQFCVHGWDKKAGRWRCRIIAVKAVGVCAVEVPAVPGKRRLPRGEHSKDVADG